MVGAVSLAAPQPVHGDESVIAWPFEVTHDGDEETLADFHLRIEEGGDLLGVRPDAENPPEAEEALYRWSGEVRGDEGFWIGDVVPPGGSVRLTIMVRPADTGDLRIRVVHWPTNGRDEPVGAETCEVWSYDTGRQRTDRSSC